ncbi:MAG: thioesterase [Pyrinomonadaceae bacterium]|nr:thioesterase [Sphingobacteriaceae bacterium]
MLNKVILLGDKKPTATTRLICFHHAGGTPSEYLKLNRYCGSDIELKVISIPRITTHSPFTDPEVSNLLIQISIIIKNLIDMPLVLFGHSMGGLMAHYYAFELAENSNLLLGLIVSSVQPPNGKLNSNSSSPSTATFWELLYDLIYLGGFPKYMMKDESLLNEAVNIYRNDLKIIELIQQLNVAKVKTPITYFGGENDPINRSNEYLAWSDKTEIEFNSKLFPGGHFYFSDQMDDFVSSLKTSIIRFKCATFTSKT